MAESKEASASYAINSASQDLPTVTYESRPIKRRNNWDSPLFCATVAFLEIIGIICVCLVAAWTANYMDGDGFAWKSNPSKQFKYHPLFMVIGLVFLYGNAIIIYRMGTKVNKTVLKLLHAVIHGGAFIFSVIALVAVFDFHYALRFPDMYSLHSWIGLITVILFSLQYALGFFTFLFPSPLEWRKMLMPFHIFFGLLLFITSIGACITGMTEKLMFIGHYSDLQVGSVIANCLGILLIVFASLVVYVATSDRFKRMPLPEELNLRSALNPQQDRSRTSL